MNVKLVILLRVITVVGNEDDVVVTHGLDDVLQEVPARRHVLQENPLLELAAVAHHGIERKCVEQPVSCTSFLEAVSILNVIT